MLFSTSYSCTFDYGDGGGGGGGVSPPPAPDTTITSGPAQGSAVEAGFGDTAVVSFGFQAVGGENPNFQCSVDSEPFYFCASGGSFTFAGLGPHTFRVRAVSNRLGAVPVPDPTPATRSFTVIGEPPPPPPDNDSFPGTTLSGLPTSVIGTNVDATKETGEPNHAGFPGAASVWYSWTAPSSGDVVIHTCDSSNFSTLLGVYTGSAVNALTEVASDEDACVLGSKVAFQATMGTVYRIAVDSQYGCCQGNFDLDIVARAANDDFANSQVLSGLPTSVAGTNVGATRETGEPAHAGLSGYASVWYSWTAPSSGQVVIDTCESDFNTLLGVYTGSAVNSLTPVASNDDACGVYRSQVSFAATMGTTYRIAVDSKYDFVSGNIDLDIVQGP